MSAVRPRPRGFTLLEVLVSLGMVALAAVVLGTAYVNVLFSYHAMQGRDAEEADAAFARALVLSEPARARAADGGRMERSTGGTMHWRAEIADTALPDLFWVALEIEFAPVAGAAPRLRREYFHVLRPSWSQPSRRAELRADFRRQLERRRRG